MTLCKIVDPEPWTDDVYQLPESEQWVFRGLEDHEYDLVSTLDRAWSRVQKATPADPGGVGSKADLEARLLRTFKRLAGRYLSTAAPERYNDLAWLAWMQHYGAPTRLLDFTYSPRVALFFALQPRPIPTDIKPRAVWAIRTSLLTDIVFDKLGSEARRVYDEDFHLGRPGQFQAIYRQGKSFVLKQNTYLQHERLTIQQGVFLCPGSVEQSWSDNLRALLADRKPAEIVRRFVIEPARINELLRDLNRMNLTTATLFPGLQGLSESLMHRALVPYGLSVVPPNGEI